MRRAPMHNRDVPVPNKLTALRNRDRCYEMHRKRLKTIKPAIDNRAPPRRPHIRAKLKRRQLMEGTHWLGPRMEMGGWLYLGTRSRRRGETHRSARPWLGPALPQSPLTQPIRAEWYDRVNRENRLLLERMGAAGC